MKPLPEPDDPYALQARIISAVCADIWDGGNRFQAMREIRKQEEHRDDHRNARD